jgi:hypothetical protein
MIIKSSTHSPIHDQVIGGQTWLGFRQLAPPQLLKGGGDAAA